MILGIKREVKKGKERKGRERKGKERKGKEKSKKKKRKETWFKVHHCGLVNLCPTVRTKFGGC